MKRNLIECVTVHADYNPVVGPWLTVYFHRSNKFPRQYCNITDSSARRVASVLAVWQAGNPQLERMRTKAAIRKWEEQQP
jgi:hypothetical protein